MTPAGRMKVKGDKPSQWEHPIFGPLQLENPLTDCAEICYQWLRRGPHHTCKVRISGLKWERAPIVVKYILPVSIFFFLYFLCSCSPAHVAL